MRFTRPLALSNPFDLAAGILVVAVCAGFAAGAWSYGTGTISRMGPGFYPFAAATVGMALGFAIIASAFLEEKRQAPSVAFRPLLFVSAAFSAFAAAIDIAGLIPSAVLAVTVAALGDTRTRLWEAGGLAAAMAVFVWLIFIVLLDLPIPAFGAP